MADRAELVKKLNDEGDFGADYIEELLNIADLDGDIEIGVEADRASVAVVTEGVADRRLKRLIGQGGEVLDALQELTRLAVQAKTGERSRLMLDIADYRESHRQEVAAIAREAVASVLANGEPVSLAPMNPFERKVVHDVAAAAGLASDSEGLGNARHVIVSEAVADDESPEDEAVSDSVFSASADDALAGAAGDASAGVVSGPAETAADVASAGAAGDVSINAASGSDETTAASADTSADTEVVSDSDIAVSGSAGAVSGSAGAVSGSADVVSDSADVAGESSDPTETENVGKGSTSSTAK